MLDPFHEELADLIAARVEGRLRQPGPTMVPEYLTPAEAAIVLNSTVRTLENWRVRRNGGPPFTRLGTKTVRYQVEDLRTFMRERRVAQLEGGFAHE